MTAPRFLADNAPWLAAGGAMTFASSFGQTYFISIYAGEIRAEFGLSHGAWGGVYTMGTLASAALMLAAGGVVDKVRTRWLAASLLLAFACVCAGMSLAGSVAALTLVVFGLRFCGQGMLTHAAIVAMGRWFSATRGRAVAIASTGHALGEAMLPLAFVALTGLVGWRASWLAASAVLVCLVPVVLLLLRRERAPRAMSASGGPGILGRHWTRGMALRHWLFWVMFPGFLAQPVFSTALFFQQVHLTEVKGWELADFVALFPLYTAVIVAALFAAGWAADRWGANRLAPLFLPPMAAAFVVLAFFDGFWAAAVALSLMGVMQGMSGAVAGALWPELYGVRHLGSIRSVASAVMVFATALGPGVTGWLIDRGVAFETQLLWMAGYAMAMAAVFAAAMARVRPLLAARA